ncbi:MAG: hypothetical protein ACRCSB_01875, partial [Bacteroidales bacterium]
AGSGFFTSSYPTHIPVLLRSTLSSRITEKEDSIFITPTNPVWPWHGVGSKRQHGARAIDYYGYSILPLGFIWTGFDFSYHTEPCFFTSTASSTAVERLLVSYRKVHIEMLDVPIETTNIGRGLPIRCLRENFLDQ